jgi:hypothetical protein
VLKLNASHWYLIHIGDADSNSTIADCPHNVGPTPPKHRMPPTQHPIHRSTSGPAGPFLPIEIEGPPDDADGLGAGCNNPSPLLHPNGTLYLACTWSLRRAPAPEGPWSEAWSIAPADATGRTWLNRSWEDCFLWVDRYGHWHVLAHTYTDDPYPAQSISGHGYSVDGFRWEWSRTEPYSGSVLRVDGSVKNFSTMERPKLLFADAGDPLRPTHLLNGASPVWDSGSGSGSGGGGGGGGGGSGGSGSNPCGVCETGACVKCKVSPGLDWTYTVVRPLAGSEG